jgi:hypothetical protein
MERKQNVFSKNSLGQSQVESPVVHLSIYLQKTVFYIIDAAFIHDGNKQNEEDAERFYFANTQLQIFHYLGSML